MTPHFYVSGHAGCLYCGAAGHRAGVACRARAESEAGFTRAAPGPYDPVRHLGSVVFGLGWREPAAGWRLVGPEDGGRGVSGHSRFRVLRGEEAVVVAEAVGVEQAARVAIVAVRSRRPVSPS